MKELQLIKSEKFGEIECDIYSNEKEMFMTSEQLGSCLGYQYARESINKLVSRNEYLRDKEFSGVTKMMTPCGEGDEQIVSTLKQEYLQKTEYMK